MKPSGKKELLLAQIVMSVCSFLRSILIARALGVENFGVASTFAVVISFIEMSTDIALDRFIIQYRFGYNRRVLSSIHGLMIIRGLITSLVLFFSAPLIAALFSLQDFLWAYQVLAFIPMVKSFTNFDYARQQKQLDYKTFAMMEGIPHVISTIALVPLLYFSVDPSVVIWVTFLNYAGFAFFSHLRSKVNYRVTFDYVLTMKVLGFSLPLILNGFLLFLILHGDRVIVGHFYTMSSLGIYAAVFSLFSVPILFSQRLMSALYTPVLARHANALSKEKYSEAASISSILCGFLAINGMLGFSILGGPVIALVYGDEFSASKIIIYALALSSAIRILRVPSSFISLSQGKSKFVLYVSLIRSSGVIFAIIFASIGYPLEYVAVSSAIGEILAIIFSFLFLNMLPLKFLNKAVFRDLIFFIFVALFCYLLTIIDDLSVMHYVSLYFTSLIVVILYYYIFHRKFIGRKDGEY
ncbi:MAG: oligosaccharide flippase family protein [Oleibacter sp.]|nr:oligosaccharide flippase family protein [Thalassolituus sp.]